MLSLTEYEPLPPLELTPDGPHRSPVFALLLSLIFPGLGQLYIGRRKNALLLILLEAIALAIVLSGSGSPTIYGIALLTAPALYCFGMADAYFAAREWNAGATGLLIGGNPRIAAILNLLTKGFGYFYLGDRTKGIACFFLVGAVQAVLAIRTNVWTSILAITIQIAIAIDGYRAARERLRAEHPDLLQAPDGGPGAIDRANPAGIPPRFAASFFVTIAAVMILGFATLRALNGESIVTQGNVEHGPSGLVYRNPAEHLAVAVPDEWDFTNPPSALAQLTADDGSSIILMVQYSMAPMNATLDALRADVLKRHSDATFSTGTATLGSRTAPYVETTFALKSGSTLRQRYVAVRRGFKIDFFIETWTADNQRAVLDGIDTSVRF